MTDKVHDLHTFMAQVTSEMASEYERIFVRSAEDPGTAGDQGEENWANLLREWLPPAYHVATKGRLIGAKGNMSDQIDVVVLKPFYPPKLRKTKIWLANGVAAAFECKTTLKASHIDSNERCSSFKALFPRQNGSPARELRSSLIYGVLAHSHSWKKPASTPVVNVHNALMKAVDSANHPSDIIDLVCIADLGCWSGMMMPCDPCEFRSDGSVIPKDPAWRPKSIMSKATISGDNQHQTFQPIGAMLAYLTKRLARNDPSIRDLADYYRLAGLWGQGSGETRHWPKSILSGIVQQAVEAGHLSNNGDGWSEWQAMFV